MNDFVGNILQNNFYAYCYILLSGTGRCTPICGAAMLLRCNWCRNLAAVDCILHWIVLTLSTLHTRYSSCITLLWLHNNHKMYMSYHKNGLVNSHQPVRKRFIFMCFVVRILMKLVGYQQPTCLCVKMEFAVETTVFRFHVNCFHFLKLLSFMWGRHNCVRKMVFRFTCAVLWKLHG